MSGSALASWRDRIQIHPAADLFPMMSDEELDELTKDIEEHGLRESPMWFQGPDGLELLDGRNRFAAIDRIADEENREQAQAWIEGFKNILSDGSDPIAYVISLNLRRRHLTGEQKREIIAALLRDKPERSNSATAKIAGSSDKTVASVRTGLEGRSEIPNVSTRVDTKGRQQPVRVTVPAVIVTHHEKPMTVTVKLVEAPEAPTTTTPPPAPWPSPADAAAVRELRPAMLSRLSALLRIDPDRTIEELIRALGDERKGIATLPKEKRIAAARGFLRAIGVAEADLRPIE
jgi:hypothetical protein